MKNILYLTSFINDVVHLSREAQGLWTIQQVSKPGQLVQKILDVSPDVVFIDLGTTGLNIFDELDQVATLQHQPPYVVYSREDCFLFHRFAMRHSVVAYFPIPCDFSRMRTRLESILDPVITTKEDICLSGEAGKALLGESLAMRSLRKRIQLVSSRSEPVLITGETGSGKELVARCIHENSPFRSGPYIARNISCISSGLADAYFFGNVKGSFTGAEDQKGIFETCYKGTLFLDEIGDMEYTLQAKLLRVLEEKNIQKVGSTKNIPLDFRLVCATNWDLGKAVDLDCFRRDLMHRLDELRIEIPPLRERTDDIQVLAAHHLKGFDKVLSEEALECLIEFNWPGNIRQLFHCLSRSACEADGPVIYPHHLRF